MLPKSKKFQNPEDIIKDIVATDFDLSRFQQIDDSHFLKPKNFYECITGIEYCNATLLQWQIEAGMHLFADYCPKCSNPEYLTELFDEPIPEILDNVTFLEHGVCPKCKKNRFDLYVLGELKQSTPSIKSEFVGNLGQRAGKSKFAVSACIYQLMRWVKLADPLGYYNLPRMEVVLGTFSALSAEQAEENLWIPFKGLYDNAPWFKKYNEFLRGEEKRLSIPLCEVKDTYIYYPHKRFLMAFTGSEARKKRGRTRLFGVIDEIAHMNSQEVGTRKKVMDADGNYTALNNSLETIKTKAVQKFMEGHHDALFSIMYNVSSPYNVQDKIMRLTKAGPSNPWFVVIHRATWEANPDYTEKALRISKSGLTESEFMRDWGAVPPFSDSPFIGDPRAIEKLCMPQAASILESIPAIYQDKMGDRYLYLKARPIRAEKVTARLLALDNGHNQNAFAAVLFHYDSGQKKPVLDFAVSLSPDPQSGTSIHFPMMFENFILPIIQAFRIQHVFYDRWQSVEQIQRLRSIKVDAQAHSLSFEKDLLPFRQQILSGNLILPPFEINAEKIKDAADPIAEIRDKPISTLIWQTLTVRQVGKKLLKPLEGDDDLFRAFALGGSRFLDEEIQNQYFSLGGVRQAMMGGRGIGSFTSYRRGGGIPTANPGGLPISPVGVVKSSRRR